MKSKILLILVSFIISFVAQARDITDNKSLNDAKTYYEQKQYEQAKDIYNDVISKGVESSEIYYNLGNIYYSAGDVGNAVVCHLRALKMDPSNANADNNLKVIMSDIEDKNKMELKGKNINILPDDLSFFENLYNALIVNVSSNVWAIVGIVFFLLTITGAVLYIFLDNVLIKKIGFFGGIISITIVIIANVFAFVGRKEYYTKDTAVIIPYSIQLKKEYKDNSVEVSTPLHSGTILNVIDEHIDVNDEKWVKLRLNSEIAGWAQEKDIIIKKVKNISYC